MKLLADKQPIIEPEVPITEEEITEEAFRWRFTARIRALAKDKGNPFGQDPATYAFDVAGVYWRERFPDGVTPEECAEEDSVYWIADAFS